MRHKLKTIDQFPVGAIASTLGLCTLANVYNIGGFSFLRLVVMLFGSIVWGIAVLKLIFHFETFSNEYRLVVPASLYATFPMLTAVLSSFYYNFFPVLGSVLWYGAVVLHCGHIGIFTYRNVIKTFDRKTFLPTWFVTYVGILVPVVVGSDIGHPWLVQGLVFYGFTATIILVPFLLMIKIPDKMAITKTIFLAPLSLCLVSYLNVVTEPFFLLVTLWYSFILLALILVFRRLLDFLKRPFNATFASLTFPLAIVTLATYRVGQYFVTVDRLQAAAAVTQLFGVLLFLVTGILLFVSYQFARQFILSLAKDHAVEEELKKVPQKQR